MKFTRRGLLGMLAALPVAGKAIASAVKDVAPLVSHNLLFDSCDSACDHMIENHPPPREEFVYHLYDGTDEYVPSVGELIRTNHGLARITEVVRSTMLDDYAFYKIHARYEMIL